MKTLFILNDAPYGSEKVYSALRLVNVMLNEFHSEIRLFFLSDSVTSALSNQGKSPAGYCISEMLEKLIEAGAKAKLCITCCDLRGINEMNIINGVEIGNLKHLSQWVIDSDKVLIF